MADPIFESIGDEAVELRAPLPNNAGDGDRILATQLRTRRVLWGCQIANNPANSDAFVRGVYSADCTRPKQATGVEIGIAVAPQKDWEPPYISVLFSLPRDTSVPEQFVTTQGKASTQHIVEMRLRGLWGGGHGFRIRAHKFDNKHCKDAYMVEIKDHEGALVSAHPWPFRTRNADIHRFFWKSLLELREKKIWCLLVPKPAMQALVLGLRAVAMFGRYQPSDFYAVRPKQWNFEALNQQLGDPSRFPRRDPYQARRRFDDINHYADIQSSAVVMENLFIQKGALDLRSSPFEARFFTPSSTNRSRCMVIIDLAGENLSEKYDGAIDNYLECGEDVGIAFGPPPSHTQGSSKTRKLDKHVWAGQFATPPPHFQEAIPPTSLCVKLPIDSNRPPPVSTTEVGTYAKYDGDLRSYKIYLCLKDTSKAARRNFNGIARLALPSPTDDHNDWARDGDSEADLTGIQHPPTAAIDRGADTFRSLLCGMAADGYFEYDLLSGVESGARNRILAAIHPAQRAPRSEFLTRIPCGTLLIHGPPGCGKSVQLAGCIALCIAQGKPVLLITTRHDAVDACLRKTEALCQTSGVDCIIIRAFVAAEDKSACKRVLRERDDWPSTPFKVRPEWRPRLSVAFWVAYYLGLESSPWTGRRLDATSSPQCFQHALNIARQLNTAPADLPGAQKSRLHDIFSVEVDRCIEYIFKSALLVAATPYSALGKVAKWFTRNRASVLAVDDAATINEAHVMQCVFNQSVFLFALDPLQLPAFSASKTSVLVPRVNTYENQIVLSLAERLFTLEWPVISMDQQFRMLPGLFDPAREAFYSQRNIVDITEPGTDTSVATVVESWVTTKGGSPPPPGKFWPVFLNITGTDCEQAAGLGSSINMKMWERFFAVLWHDFLKPEAEFRVPRDKICIVTPSRAMTDYIKEYLRDRDLDLTTATIHSYQGQEKELVFFFSTLSASPSLKAIPTPNRLCVAFTRMKQGLIVVGDSGISTGTGSKKELIGNGRYLDTKAFHYLWGWFPRNGRVVQLRA